MAADENQFDSIAVSPLFMQHDLHPHAPGDSRASIASMVPFDLLKCIIDTAPIRVFWKDRDLRYLGCNAAFARDAGYTDAARVLHKTDHELVWSANAEQYREDDRAVLASGEPRLSYEEPQTTADGRTVWLRTSKVPLRNPDGAIVGVLGIYDDITEYKRTQQALQVSEEQFRSAFYLTPDALTINRMHDGLYVSVNHGFTSSLGYTAQEVVGHSSLEFNIWEDPAVRARLVRGLQENGVVVNLEAVFRAKDGRRVHGLMSASVIYLQGVAHLLAITRDISERKKLEESLSLAASVFANSREGIMITSLDGTIMDVNAAFSDITGYRRDEVLGKNPRILHSGRHDADYYAAMWVSLHDKGHWYGEVWNRRKNGEIYAEMQTISTVYDASAAPLHFVSLFSDISAYKEHQHQLERIAHYDALTGLPNRVLLADRMRQGIAQVQRRKQLMAVAFLDLDGFKAINDKYGHEAGDQVLVAVSTRMIQSLREGDTLARIGGDEFVAVMLDLPDVGASVRMLTRLLEAVAQPLVFGEMQLKVCASVGVTFYPQTESVDPDQLLRQADQAMYQAKLAGKNRYHLFDPELDRSVRGHHESLDSIRQALARQEFVLYYQPKVNMRTGEVVGVEALIRWQHPVRGLLSPASFLPVVEGQPLAVDVGEWVIDAALTQIVRWRHAGLQLPISVNVGARQLQQPDFVARLRDRMAQFPTLHARDLEMEVLETSALEDLTHVSRVIDECRQLGVHFALDDFGSGYSSLTYLKRLPVTKLKIDQSFVRDLLVEPDDLAILEGIIGLANAFRRQVIAEGVESVEAGRLLLQMGCELAQGFCIARPMPAQDIPDWIARWRPDPAWLNQCVVSKQHMPLLSASVEHRAWMLALENYVAGARDAPPPLDDSQCRVGVWFHSGGLDFCADLPLAAAVMQAHHAVHQCATQMVAFHVRGDSQGVCALRTELAILGQQFLAQMQVLLRASVKVELESRR